MKKIIVCCYACVRVGLEKEEWLAKGCAEKNSARTLSLKPRYHRLSLFPYRKEIGYMTNIVGRKYISASS